MKPTLSREDLPAPFSKDDQGNPGRAYADVLTAPVHRIDIRPDLRPWLVTRMADVRLVLSDPVFSIDPASTSQVVRDAIARGRPEERVALLGRNLLSVDPPDHTRMRRVMSGALSARRVAEVAATVDGTVRTVLTRYRPGQTVDLLREVTVPIAVEVICEVIGIPAADRARFVAWGHQMVTATLEDEARFDEVSEQMADYLVPFVLSHRHAPAVERPTLVQVLAAARNADQLDDYEVISLVYQLFFAGHESSAHFMSSAVLTLLRHPDQWAQLRTNPGLVDGAVEELLRLEGPVKVPTWRFATRPIRLSAAELAPGDPVLALLSAAARDRACHEQPDKFLVTRHNTTHVSFGYGIHHCMGAALARAEARTFLLAVLETFPDIALAEDFSELAWRVNLMMRGVCALPVQL